MHFTAIFLSHQTIFFSILQFFLYLQANEKFEQENIYCPVVYADANTPYEYFGGSCISST